MKRLFIYSIVIGGSIFFLLFATDFASDSVPFVVPDSASTEKNTVEQAQDEPTWYILEKHHIESTSSSLFTLTHIMIDKHDITSIDINHNESPKFLGQWLEGDGIAINGGYFLEDYQPAGQLYDHGDIIQDRMFDADKSSTLLVRTNTLAIVTPTTSFDLYKKQGAQYALQSFPLLVENGISQVQSDSGKTARRTAIGYDKHGNTHIFVVNSHAISLYQFARAIASVNASSKMTALNLDGGPSTGLVLQAGDTKIDMEGFVPVPNVITITPKK